jgi:N-formylmaleamate deformylase
VRKWFEGHVVSNEHSLRYYRSGGDLPPLVLVHGFTDNARYFTRVAEALASEWDVVAYDSRGHGHSDRTTVAFTDASRTDDLLSVVTQLDLDRPAMLGHSMGGATIAHAIANNPRLSRGAVLEDPAWWEPTPAEIAAGRADRIERNRLWRLWVQAIQEMPYDDALAMRTNDEPNWNPIDIATSLDGRREFQLELFDHFPPEASPWRHLVPKFDCPILLAIGGNVARGRLISRETADGAAELNPLVTVAEIPAAGHHLKYDGFDDFIAAVRAFLDPLRH